MAPVFAGCLDDPRVQLTIGDVSTVIAAGKARYDGILLDVDNGPEGLTVAANDRLYGAAGLAAAKTALRPGGVLAVWSSGPDHGFTRRLRDAGLATEEVTVRASRTGRGARHVIWLDAPLTASAPFLKAGGRALHRARSSQPRRRSRRISRRPASAPAWRPAAP